MIIKNKFSILTALIIMYLSMASSHTFDKVPIINIPNIDKIVHFGMYFGLTSVLILENKRALRGTYSLFIIALIALSYGIVIEFMQSALTVTRTGNVFDALADFAGILVSILLWLWIKRFITR
jgi:VanZ family protein